MQQTKFHELWFGNGIGIDTGRLPYGKLERLYNAQFRKNVHIVTLFFFFVSNNSIDIIFTQIQNHTHAHTHTHTCTQHYSGCSSNSVLVPAQCQILQSISTRAWLYSSSKLHFSMNRESNWSIWSRFHPILFVVWSINNPAYSPFKIDLVQLAYSSHNWQMLSGARKLYCGCGGLQTM